VLPAMTNNSFCYTRQIVVRAFWVVVSLLEARTFNVGADLGKTGHYNTGILRHLQAGVPLVDALSQNPFTLSAHQGDIYR
jgi:hypothetical protein